MRIYSITMSMLLTLIGVSIYDGLTRAANALVPVSSCNFTCLSNCALITNLNCSSGIGVTLANGVSLDMQGWDISCTSRGGCDTAVKMTQPSSVIFSSTALDPNDPRPRINGAWQKGVDCQGLSNSRVTGIDLRGYWVIAGTHRCAQVDHNRFGGLTFESGDITGEANLTFPNASRYCIIFPVSVAGQTFISNNYIDGCQTAIEWQPNGVSSTSLAITNNTINAREYAPQVFPPAIIDLVANAPRTATVTGNVFTGDSRSSVLVAAVQSTATVTYGNDICKFGLDACDSCVSDGQCVATGTTTSP